MNKPVHLVIFDLGSTLIYENGPWDTLFPRADAALWQVLRKYGVKLDPRQIYRDSETIFDMYYKDHRSDLNEPGTARVLSQLLHENGYNLPDEYIRNALGAMYAITQTNWLAEADAVPTLKSLKQAGYHIGLISNAADDDNTQALIDKAKLRPYLEFIISSAAFGKRKPDPTIFQLALDHFGVPPGEAVMVGDNFEADIVGAHRASMQGLWITRRAVDAAPDGPEAEVEAVVQTLEEIPGLLRAA